jgi:hypothetical protein
VLRGSVMVQQSSARGSVTQLGCSAAQFGGCSVAQLGCSMAQLGGCSGAQLGYSVAQLVVHWPCMAGPT